MPPILISTLLAVQLAVPPATTPSQTAPALQAPMVSTAGQPTVVLIDRTGAEHNGRLLRAGAHEVVLRSATGERTFRRNEVAQIEKRDSLRNGTLIGAAVGVIVGIPPALFIPCPEDGVKRCPGFKLGILALSTGAYAGVGAALDASVKGRTLIYRAGSVTLTAAQGGAEAGFSIRW